MNRFNQPRYLIVVATILAFFHELPLHAQFYSFSSSIYVGAQPLFLVSGQDGTHILCGQTDVNFNGIQDAGDSTATWAVMGISRNFNTLLRIKKFAWGEDVGFPCRPGFDFSTQTLYLAQNGRLRAFDTQTQAIKRDTVLLLDSLCRSTFNTIGTVSALTVDTTAKRLLISLRGRSTSAVVELDLLTNRITARYSAGILVQQTLPFTNRFNRKGLAILNEGTFGSSNSTIMLADTPNQIFTLNIGDTGNHIVKLGDTLAITMNGSHSVHLFDLGFYRIVKTFSTETTGFNGPRESAFFSSGSLVTTTYEGKILFFDDFGRKVLFSDMGKQEGIIASNRRQIVIANTFRDNSYTPANNLFVFSWIPLSVKSNNNSDRISIQPNPTNNISRITLNNQQIGVLDAKNISITLVNVLGKTIATLTPQNTSPSSIEAEFSAESLGLAQGMYFVHIRSAQGMTAVPVHIIR